MANNTSLSIIKDGYTSDSQALISHYSLSRFELVIEDAQINKSDLDKLISTLKTFDFFHKYEFEISSNYSYKVFTNDKYLIYMDVHKKSKKVSVTVYYNNYKDGEKILNIINKYRFEDNENIVNIHSFYYDKSNDIKANEISKIYEDFKRNSNDYYPFLDIQELFNQYMMDDSNILLLAGEPGTGKTRLGDMFMKYLLENVETTEYEDIEEISVAYVKNEHILSNDMFWNELKNNEYNLVFLDDLDFSLLPRTQSITTNEDVDKNKFISNLLSYTDGIFENGNKTKFIITTNKSVDEIDSAVLRKGRTFAIINLRQLKREEALMIWLKADLELEMFNDLFKEDIILQADLGTEINFRLAEKELGKKSKPWALEDGINVYQKSKIETKIGL